MKNIVLYGLATFGVICAYDRFFGKGSKTTSTNGTANGTLGFQGTNWQRSGYGGTYWQNQNNNFAGRGRRRGHSNLAGYNKFTGTQWQQAGRDKTTNWQQKGVFQNACGGCA
jgi:hypothetical protein